MRDPQFAAGLCIHGIGIGLEVTEEHRIASAVCDPLDRHRIAYPGARLVRPVDAAALRIQAVHVARIGTYEYATRDDAWLSIGRGTVGEAEGPLQLKTAHGVARQSRLGGVLEEAVGAIRPP